MRQNKFWMNLIRKSICAPEKNEYAEYYETYVSLVDETDVVAGLQNQLTEMQNLLAEITEEKGAFAYGAGKWTIKELIGHLSDGEKIFAYRALRISRADETPLEGFEQDAISKTRIS